MRKETIPAAFVERLKSIQSFIEDEKLQTVRWDDPRYISNVDTALVGVFEALKDSGHVKPLTAFTKGIQLCVLSMPDPPEFLVFTALRVTNTYNVVQEYNKCEDPQRKKVLSGILQERGMLA